MKKSKKVYVGMITPVMKKLVYIGTSNDSLTNGRVYNIKYEVLLKPYHILHVICNDGTEYQQYADSFLDIKEYRKLKLLLLKFSKYEK